MRFGRDRTFRTKAHSHRYSQTLTFQKDGHLWVSISTRTIKLPLTFPLRSLRQIVERGMAQRLISVWKPKRPQCPESHSSSPVPVSLAEFSPALVMIAVAFCLSTCIMLVETVIVKSLLPPLFRIGEKISSEERSLESGEKSGYDTENIGEI